MPDMLRRFFNRSPQARVVCLEKQAIDLLKARRLAQLGYMKEEGEKSLEFLNLLCEAEEKLDQTVDQLLGLE